MTDNTSATPPAWSGPGIIQNFVTIPASSKLSEETLKKWLDEVYVPALIESGVVKSAWLYKAAKSHCEWPLMTIYKIPELQNVQAGKLQDIKRTSELFPTSGPLEDFVISESRVLGFEQLYETTKQPEGQSTIADVLRLLHMLDATSCRQQFLIGLNRCCYDHHTRSDGAWPRWRSRFGRLVSGGA
jgi:hypothetical protein